MSIHLLIIDPQNDFCNPDGSLYVPNAEEDMVRLMDLIHRKIWDINEITVSLDCHHYYDIAHPSFWLNRDGIEPAPFTSISMEDIETGKYLPKEIKAYSSWIEEYFQALQKAGKAHMIWPYHCLVGSWGGEICIAIQNALISWERENRKTVKYIFKGLNPLTEHFSAISAVKADPRDPDTGFNFSLTNKLDRADQVWLAGEASSHCVKDTWLDMTKVMYELNNVKIIKDCMSPVAGFEKDTEAFYQKYSRHLVSSVEL